MGRDKTVRGNSRRNVVQTLFEKAEKILYQNVLMISGYVHLLDPYDKYDMCIQEPLLNVFKLVKGKRFDEIELYVESINLFRQEM